jgi:mannose-6-phosphate isomerase-like protein (cupin superfamily)
MQNKSFGQKCFEGAQWEEGLGQPLKKTAIPIAPPKTHAMQAQEYFFEEGCFIQELQNDANDPMVSVARARVRPGETTRWHSLSGITERYLILEGEGRAEVGTSKPLPVGPGDRVLIPPNTRQRITNIGQGDLIFLAVCTPRFVAEAYQDIEAGRI